MLFPRGDGVWAFWLTHPGRNVPVYTLYLTSPE